MSEQTMLPIGSILPYTGNNPFDLDANWLMCDGTLYLQSDYPDLFTAIGSNFGGTGGGQFNVPDLRGLFVRACDNGSGRDSRAAARTALNPGGNVQTAVGSYQIYGTASPKTNFSATFMNCDLSSSHDDRGCAASPGQWNDNTTTVTPDQGGDKESRPVNSNVNWIIKASASQDDGYAPVPTGAIVAFAGNDPAKVDAATWLMCDGRALAIKGKEYHKLAGVINNAFGAPDKQQFCLPDLRGLFLRGLDSSPLGRDPDVATRTAPLPGAGPDGHTGNAGAGVGSLQGSATGLPQNPFSSSLQHLPDSDDGKRVAGTLYPLSGGFDGALRVDVSVSGGDAESRPRNAAVDWFVARTQADGTVPDDLVPVGAIIALGMQAIGSDNFLLCDGRTLLNSQYNELFAQIGSLYGGDDTHFCLPNYQGIMLRGADHGTNRDPDANSRLFSAFGDAPAAGTAGSYQDYATQLPGTHFTASVSHIPQGTHDSHGATNGGVSRVNGDLTTTTCTSGGDGDTAPSNVYVQYFIKTRR